MGSAFSKFCMRCCCYCCIDSDSDNDDEKQPLMPPDPLDYFSREVQKRRDEETNLWSEPGDRSHSERDDDRALYSLLQARNKTRMGSSGYRRLSVDIEAMRDTRREVRDKWKTVLENLGFMAEADSLLTVSAGASLDRMRNAAAARNLLQTLHSETSIFNSRESPPERYLFILVRSTRVRLAASASEISTFSEPDCWGAKLTGSPAVSRHRRRLPGEGQALLPTAGHVRRRHAGRRH
ncbi:melanoregulin isoform X2 [Dunckerocampus dactyliophorus]|uniref:melanoregulin isoform X2 n=1 Tax=Dunckerocampus dactyliophorus TaxID=161453 RepID=UPI002406D731|nr:melanoregulin isoform X2 [Dunckerocampus dactyliophorus]